MPPTEDTKPEQAAPEQGGRYTMPRPTKAGAGGQLPRNDADTTTELGVAHDHGDGAKNHMHRLGDLSHLHGEDGKAVLLDEHGRPLFTDDDQELHAPDPIPGSTASDYFNGDNTPDRDAELETEAAEIAQRRPDAIATNGQPRPASLSGAPGSRLSDVSSFSSTLTLFGIPVELQDEFTWAQIGKHALDSMIEEMIRTRQPSDPALISAALDAVFHIGKARNLA